MRPPYTTLADTFVPDRTLFRSSAVGAGGKDDRGPERDQQPLVLVPVVDRGVEHRAERGVDLDAVVEAVDEGRDLFVGGLRGHADEMRARRQFTSIARKGPSLMIAPARRKRLDQGHGRSEERRGGKECVSTGNYRWSRVT